MLKRLIFIFTICCLLSCTERAKQRLNQADTDTVHDRYEPISDDVLETAIIYEANIRQYSPEGTLAAFTKDISQLKDLGVKILWVMPPYPISMKNRKAKGDLMVEDIEDEEERKKYLGSYYAVADYTEINPDLGTKEDFDEMVEMAHANGMYVILDWVANHTGWDNQWITDHPEYYTMDQDSTIIHPAGTDWTDTADLNYDNPETRFAMRDAMAYWIKEHDIDGYRCDVAHEVPTDFWNATIKELRTIKPLFMLAESEKKELFYEAFDMGYNWEGHHLINQLAQNKATPKDWHAYMRRNRDDYQQDDILMNFVTNHDENSWNGTIKERLGDRAEALTVFSYALPGMPLIYSGQEYGLDHRLKFFEKDSIPKIKGERYELLKNLGKLKNHHTSLHGGKNPADYDPILTDTGLLAFKRGNEGARIYYLANFTQAPIKTTIPGLSGTIRDMIKGTEAVLTEATEITIHPNQYRLLEKAE
ncbi:MAG: alpha-amylase family glycosyl hydrolase [Nonlabens sp.]